MIAKIKMACLRSLTIARGYFLALAGGILQALDSITDALGDPGLKDQISSAIGDPRLTGRILLAVSVVTIAVRLRSLRKAQPS
jgi:hypothetical protein